MIADMVSRERRPCFIRSDVECVRPGIRETNYDLTLTSACHCTDRLSFGGAERSDGDAGDAGDDGDGDDGDDGDGDGDGDDREREHLRSNDRGIFSYNID